MHFWLAFVDFPTHLLHFHCAHPHTNSRQQSVVRYGIYAFVFVFTPLIQIQKTWRECEINRSGLCAAGFHMMEQTKTTGWWDNHQLSVFLGDQTKIKQISGKHWEKPNPLRLVRGSGREWWPLCLHEHWRLGYKGQFLNIDWVHFSVDSTI